MFTVYNNTAVNNTFLLSTYKPPPGDRGLREQSHKQYRRDLQDALFESSVHPREPNKTQRRKSTKDIVWRPVEEHQHKRVWRKQVFCSACIEAKRPTTTPHRAARKPLANLSANSTMKKREDSDGWKRRTRPPRTSWGCTVCRIPFCTRGTCWGEHLARLNTKD
ncbi:uncharacterized protein BDZ99DRAFT_548987 [Mytilinidion resinicola]|uniref:PiggyBac transposable element-derived protein 4 C-terminal zinc-ribbon domain-containing protein n=1 Tax=Mytilinidion resinicola TaxID=574789 RepID=A0A6A6Z3S7_9PEZI|nr:uncharacterized protein BDZ99DRAFT_548987 [Mytilinidion resinicola]KAF2814815.1 hypothetical protein BDZ99DRAFT_548987 [Mytilinidion resinicola]